MNATARRGLTHVLPPVLWAGLIFFLSSRPAGDLPLPTLFPHTDKIVHLLVYALLGALLVRSGRDEWIAKPPWSWVIFCWLTASAYGASDEWHQSFVNERTASLADWLMDTVGVAFGVVGWLFIKHRR